MGVYDLAQGRIENRMLGQKRVISEDYNSFAVENEKELADLIRKDPATSKVTENAKKLMDRHMKFDWSNLL